MSTPTQFVTAYNGVISYAPITAGVPGTYTKVAQSKDLGTPAVEVGDINVTNNDSPGNFKEFAPGMVDGGEFEFDIVYYKAGHETLLGLVGNGLVYSWKEAFTDGTIATFPGYLKKAGLEGKTEDGVLEGKISIKVTGPVVFS